MKKIFLALFMSTLMNAMELVEPNAVSSKDALKLYTNMKDFYVEDENAAYRVERCDMNKELRTILQHKALDRFKENGYIRINKMNTGKYALAAHVRGLGGGPGGASAGFFVGKFITYGVCHGAIYVASLFTGPAQPVSSTAAHLTAHPFIEAASNKVGIAFGLLGGIITGPG